MYFNLFPTEVDGLIFEKLKVLILNGGTGSRMNMSRPKCLLELARGETILSRQIRQLKNKGLHDITVAVSNQKEAYFLKEGVLSKVTSYAVLNRGFESVATLMQALEVLKRHSLILHGDVIMSNDTLDEIIKWSRIDDIMFIGDAKYDEIFGFTLNDFGLDMLRVVPDPFSVYHGKSSDNFNKLYYYKEAKLWELYHYLRKKTGMSKYFIPKNFICDVDTQQDYKWVKKYMVEHKV